METCIATPAPEAPGPVGAAQAGAAAPVGFAAGRGSPLRGVLLVVDDPDLQSRLARRFSRSGYRVVGAPSAEAAIAVCIHWWPDVVLIDETVRGGHSGRDIARALQRRVPDLRAVILGANDGTFEKVDAIAAAAASLLAEVAAASKAGASKTAAAKPALPVAPTAPIATDAVRAAPARITSSDRTAKSARPSRSSARRR